VSATNIIVGSNVGFVTSVSGTVVLGGTPLLTDREVIITPAAAQMDGHADVVGSTIAGGMAVARMDGQGSLAASGITVVTATGQMDGRASMIAAWPLGSAVGNMDGVASMVAGSAHTPVTYVISITENIICHLAANVRHDMRVQLQHNINLKQSMLASARYRAAWQDTVSLADSHSYIGRFVQKLRDSINITTLRGFRTQYHYEFIDPVNVRPALAPSWNAVLNLMQSVGISQTTSQKFIWGRILTQAFRISAALGSGGSYQVSLAQLFKIIERESFKLRHPVALNQDIDLSSLLVGGISLKLLQKILIASTTSRTFDYHLTLLGRLLLADIPGHYHFAAAALEELFTVQPALDRQFVASNALAELLTISPVFTNKLILKITGNIQLSPEQLVSMLYAGDELLDGIEITVLYVSPSGTTTTWVVNTRTEAVTEYTNYAFNSFSKLGDRYIAAGHDGLYELDGDTDDGELIISKMMSGYLQLNEKKLFGIKGAYVAIRGGGRFYLKLISGDGREYVYELRAQPNLMTTKVRVGKGIKTTYMAFELVTEGQDFDLDSIEFIPMTSGRRV
jgi:hypothetical protein